MVNITLAIPNELHKKLKIHSEIRWSDVIRRILEKRLEDLEIMDEIVSKSRFSEENVEEIGQKIKERIARRHDIK